MVKVLVVMLGVGEAEHLGSSVSALGLLLIGPALDRDPFSFSYDRSLKISRNYIRARSSKVNAICFSDYYFRTK